MADPFQLVAVLGYAGSIAVTIVIGFRVRCVAQRTSIRGTGILLIICAHILLLHLVTLRALLPLPRELAIIPSSVIAISMPATSIPLLLRLRKVFVRRETQVEDIEWSVVGLKTGLMKMYRIWSQALFTTVRSVLSDQVIRGMLDELKVWYRPLRPLEIGADGTVLTDLESAEGMEVDEIVKSYTIMLNRIFASYRMLLGSAADARIAETFQPLLASCGSTLKEKPQIASSLFGGILSRMASTGTALDDCSMGGIRRGTAILVEGDGRALGVFTESYLLQALTSCEECVYLTCSMDPQGLRDELSSFAAVDPSRLHVIDCRGAIEAEPGAEGAGDFPCPHFGLVDYSVQEILGRLRPRGGRALIDIVPDWIASCKANGIAPVITGLARIIEALRRSDFATVFIVGPGKLEPQERSILEEMVASTLQLKESGKRLIFSSAKGFSKATGSHAMNMDLWERSSMSRHVRSGPVRREGTHAKPPRCPRSLAGPRGAIQVLQTFDKV